MQRRTDLELHESEISVVVGELVNEHTVGSLLGNAFIETSAKCSTAFCGCWYRGVLARPARTARQVAERLPRWKKDGTLDRILKVLRIKLDKEGHRLDEDGRVVWSVFDVAVPTSVQRFVGSFERDAADRARSAIEFGGSMW
ncbi:MAG: hypothetical protein IT436_14615 [Phycisphaerales bacterium]|nr:hypothetical protein [Phycisphaerales bacterium]